MLIILIFTLENYLVMAWRRPFNIYSLKWKQWNLIKLTCRGWITCGEFSVVNTKNYLTNFLLRSKILLLRYLHKIQNWGHQSTTFWRKPSSNHSLNECFHSTNLRMNLVSFLSWKPVLELLHQKMVIISYIYCTFS